MNYEELMTKFCRWVMVKAQLPTSLQTPLRGIGAHELLNLLALGHESNHGSRVGFGVDLILLFKPFVEMFGETKIEIATADVRIASSC